MTRSTISEILCMCTWHFTIGHICPCCFSMRMYRLYCKSSLLHFDRKEKLLINAKSYADGFNFLFIFNEWNLNLKCMVICDFNIPHLLYPPTSSPLFYSLSDSLSDSLSPLYLIYLSLSPVPLTLCPTPSISPLCLSFFSSIPLPSPACVDVTGVLSSPL